MLIRTIIFSLLLFTYSCQNLLSRKVASQKPEDMAIIKNFYLIENEILRFEDLERRYIKTEKSKIFASKLLELRKNRENILNKINSQAEKNPKILEPQITSLNFEQGARKYSKQLIFKNFEQYQIRNGKYHQYILDLHSASSYELELIQHLQRSYTDANKPELLKAKFSCEGSFKLKKLIRWKKYKKEDIAEFDWYQSKSNAQRVGVKITPNSQKCLLSFFDPKNRNKKYAIEFIGEKSSSQLDKFINRFEYCEIPNLSEANRLDTLYVNTKYKSMTCPREVTGLRTLEKPMDGINAKAYAMLGQDLPEEMLKKQDPYWPLDFSKAPELDGIYISYLVFRRDFYGTVIERLLRYHAQKGTRIKILVSEVISLDKDKEMLTQLDREFSNISVEFYKFDPFGPRGLKEQLSALHRTMHVKLFLAYSADNDQNNVAIIGGRNIHDGFVYDTKPDLSKYPNLVQYGSGQDGTYAKWTDFEIELKGTEIVESLIGHFHSLYEYDNEDFFFRNYSLNKPTQSNMDTNYLDTSNKTLVRHYMSFPYKDDMALEQLMIDLLDSASESISISTPYFHLTQKLAKAFSRAVERGIKIDLITRLDLEGDTADIILSDVNKGTVNKFSNSIEIYEFTKKSDILHSKLFLIDGKVTLIGSVNLNQRSFYHDIENVLLIHSPDFYSKIKNVLESYKTQTVARRITTEQKTVWWKTLIIKMLKKEL